MPFQLFAQDITTIDPFTIKDIPVVETVIGGESVYPG